MRLDPNAAGTFDKLERQARLSYLVTSLTARDYAKVVLHLLRSDLFRTMFLPGMDAASNGQCSA
jgi:hypothetical protein